MWGRGTASEHKGSASEDAHRIEGSRSGVSHSTVARSSVRGAAGGKGKVGRRAGVAGGGIAALLSTAHFTGDALNSMLAALLPTLQDRFSLSATAVAALAATLWFSSSMTQPVFGALSDRLGRRLVGSVGIVLNTVLLSLMGVVPSVWLLVAVILVGGFGSAALHPVGTGVARLAGGRNKGLAIGLFSAGGMIGFAVGPAVILYVVSAFGLGSMPWLMVPGVLIGILMWFLLPDEDRMSGNIPSGEPPYEELLEHGHGKLFDAGLFFGPVGLLTVAGILASLSTVTFTSAVPLWLVDGGFATDSPLIGWTLGAFALASGISGIVSGYLSEWVDRRILVSGSMVAALAPLSAMFFLEPGTPAFLAVVALAGALVYANLPHMILSAQDLAPHAMGVASGMLMGFTMGTAGLIYVGIGWLQELMGIAPAMALGFSGMLPAAIIALYVLSQHRAVLGRPD